MRWSKLFIPTLRDAPADAEAASHKLLIRAGFMRQLHSGHYSLLPLGHKVHEKIAMIIRHHMNDIGGQEFTLPTMHPASVWKKSGRWDVMGDEMFRLVDRKGAELAMGMTEEEIFATLGTELISYKQLPQIWYQCHWKFRDEPRPKSGLLRVREFVMKDSYSFDIDEAGLDASFDLHHGAYSRIFENLQLPAFPVQASSGAMGGSASIEFMVPSPAGEDDVIRCDGCGYAANVERATSAIEPVSDAAPPAAPERFATPGIRTIVALEEAGAPAINQIKTMVMVIDGAVTLALVRGDHQLNMQKLQDASGGIEIRPATPEEALKSLSANPGSLGAVAVSEELRIIADHALEGRTSMTTGANEDDWHWRGVDIARDIRIDEWADLREVAAGEPCATCGTALTMIRCIESGHIFKLGRKYAEAMEIKVLDENGKTQVPIMGSYGIGVGRAMAAIVETFHDDKGMQWPMAVAPYEVCVTIVNAKDEASMIAGEALYADLRNRGIDVILDDRKARPGVKFKDSELVGFPYRITLGPKTLEDNEVEFTPRATGETERMAVDAIAEHVTSLVEAAR